MELRCDKTLLLCIVLITCNKINVWCYVYSHERLRFTQALKTLFQFQYKRSVISLVIQLNRRCSKTKHHRQYCKIRIDSHLHTLVNIANIAITNNVFDSSRASCQKGPTRHAYAWQIGRFWQDTFELRYRIRIFEIWWNDQQGFHKYEGLFLPLWDI